MICSENDSKTFLTPYIQSFYSLLEHIYLYIIYFVMLFEELLLLKFILIYFDNLIERYQTLDFYFDKRESPPGILALRLQIFHNYDNYFHLHIDSF